MTTAAYVLDAVRTPFGKHSGALSGVRPDDLAASVLRALVARSPGLDPADVDDVVMGNANGAGEENRNVARMAALLADFPVTVPGTTVNRLCGSGLESVFHASRAIETRDATLVIAGGVESMSRAPWVMLKPERPFPHTDAALVSTALGWRLVNPAMPQEWTISLGEATERLRERHGISRQAQDEYALASHRKAQRAWDEGRFASSVVRVAGTDLLRDEAIRADTSAERLAGLAAVFRQGGTVTAGNSSPLSDGASAALVGDARTAERVGVAPLARIAGRGLAADDPQYFGYAPVAAAERALAAAGIDWGDVGAVELNEAFAAQSLACLEGFGIDPDIMNSWGGAIALGHPLGASGGRVLATLAARMRVDNVRWGVAALCIGVGQGIAIVLERA